MTMSELLVCGVALAMLGIITLYRLAKGPSAADRAVGPSPLRWSRGAANRNSSMTQARTTEGLPPVSSA